MAEEGRKTEDQLKRKKLWQHMNPVGRPPKFKNAKMLWESAVAYFEWADSHPISLEGGSYIYRRMVKGNDELKKAENNGTAPRPYTLAGLCTHAGIRKHWADFRKEYAQKGEEFSDVLNAIENIIRTQQVEGAMVNLYNANLTARINGITDRTQTELTGANGEPLAQNPITIQISETKAAKIDVDR